MEHRCKVTVLRKECDERLQEEYLRDPKAGPCPFFDVGQEFVFSWNDGSREDFWHMLGGSFPCAEAWDCIGRYVYTALHGGSPMTGWSRDDRQFIACCNDGTRPVIFKIERLDEEGLE